MKKFFGLLSCILILNSCDDGKISTQGITFDPLKPVKSCTPTTGLYYKINGPEALILQTPTLSFANVVTPENQPRTVLIDNTNTKVLLRSFNGTVIDSYFCSVIPPSTPIVTEEWDAKPGVQGQSGYIEITTTTIKDTTAITGYNHHIVFKNITFANSKSSFVYDNYVYGNYTTTP